jgi:hypothetical protein
MQSLYPAIFHHKYKPKGALMMMMMMMVVVVMMMMMIQYYGPELWDTIM